MTQEVIQTLVSSGPVPNPVDLYAYTPDHQERIMRMAEASRTDESDRRSQVVEAQTLVIKRGQWIQAVIFVACIAGAFVTVGVFKQPIGGIFLAPPVIQGINQLIGSRRP